MAYSKSSVIRQKLSRKMTLQAVFIALVAILGIGSTSVIMEQLLVREALNSEAKHFWKNYDKNQNFPPPNTANLKGYLSVDGADNQMPDYLQNYDLGYHKVDGAMAHSLLYVSEHNGKRIHLLFDGKSVMRLAIIFGVVPLTIALLLIYLASWWVYRESNVLVSPIVWLANKYQNLDPAKPETNFAELLEVPGDIDWEIEQLVRSLNNYSKRINLFMERERSFTRDASHEFRTPLTVIKMASDLLIAEHQLDDYSKKYATRIKKAATDMEELIDAFLVLARETDQEFETEAVDVFELTRAELKSVEVYNQEKNLELKTIKNQELIINTAPKVLAIIIGNLIRNAVLYTESGSITVTTRSDHIEVKDTGIGLSEEQIKRIFTPYYRVEDTDKLKRTGYGVGLTIVQRLCNRFNWRVTVDSELGKGSTFRVFFS